MHDRIADLDELVLKCQDQRAGAHLREAISCYQAGAMRAAIISTWIAVAFDFIDKIQILEAQGDAQAKQFAEDFRKIRQIRYSNEFSSVLAALKVNPRVDSSWWNPLLRGKNAEDFLRNVFIVPSPPRTEEIIQANSQV